MSYCYTSGQPGVDMTLGFGTEPGNLIREKINLASCLSSYIPTNKNVTQSNKHIYANTECFDGTFTHYYFDNNTISPSDDILVMSINKKDKISAISPMGLLKLHNTQHQVMVMDLRIQLPHLMFQLEKNLLRQINIGKLFHQSNHRVN